MTELRITDGMWFVWNPQGAILEYIPSQPVEEGVLDIFAVTMNHNSLRACHRALEAERVSWQNNDKSFAVTGTRDAVTLSFALQEPPFGIHTATLAGAALEAFRAALATLSGR